MTEQQFNHLKRILVRDTSANSSAELDAAIITAATEQAAVNANRVLNTAPRSRISLLLLMLQSALTRTSKTLRFVPVVSLALVMTLGLLLAMGQWVAIDPPSPLVKPIRNVLPFAINSLDDDRYRAEPERIMPPELSLAGTRPTGTQRERNNLLMIYQLPDARSIIASMQFDLEQERNSATQNIQLALNDMNQMIREGQLDEARQRYELLLNQCRYCVLPNSLELLVLTHQTRAAKPLSDTG